MRQTRKALAAFVAAGALVLPLSIAYADKVSVGDEEDDTVEEEVIVTGTYIRRKNQADVSSPIDTVGIEDIQANGWTDLEDVAETFTFNTSSWGRSGLRSGCCGETRGIELRALGSSSTLVLQNGKRVASTRTGASGADMTDIKALMPVIAIDRIETLLDGGAALYGSDAVAGVVNIIPRKDFEGLEIRTGGKHIEGAGQWEAQMLFGVSGDRVSGMFALGYEHHDQLRNRERPFRLINNTSGNGTPGTYNLGIARDANGDPLPGQRPVARNGNDVIIDNGLNGAINYSALWDQAANAHLNPGDASNPFTALLNSSADPLTTMRIADPYCRPGIVPDYPGGMGSQGQRGVTIPGGGQYTPQYGGAPFPLGSCRFTYQPTNSISPEENNFLGYSNWQFDITDRTALELEYSTRISQTWTMFVPSFPITNAASKPFIPADSPANPLGVKMDWTGRPIGNAYEGTPVDAKVEGDAQSHRVSLTLNSELGEFIEADWAQSWTVQVSSQYSWDRTSERQRDTDLQRIQLAMEGFGGQACEVRFDGPASASEAGKGACFYWSPLAADIYNSTFDPTSGFGSVFQTDQNGNRVDSDDRTTFDVINYFMAESESFNERWLMVNEIIATGDIFELPGGIAGLALGFQNRRQHFERFDTAFQQTLNQGFLSPGIGGEGGRSVEAMFTELYLPLIENFDVQIAVRREEYSDGLGKSTDPKIGFNWRPTEEVAFRASWGTSFRAPSLRQVVGNDKGAFVTEIRDPIDPVEFNTGSGTFRTILIAKNPDLVPEESENFNVGFSWIPELPWGDGSHVFQFDVDYFDFEFENRINVEAASNVVNRDPCGADVQRDPINFIQGPLLENDPTGNCGAGPVGNVLIVNQTFFNSGGTTVSGLDIGMRYSWDVGANQFTIRNETSWMLDYEIQTSAGGNVIDGVGYTNDGNPGSPVPEIRTNFFVNWLREAHNAGATFRWISGMDDDIFGSRPSSREIDSHLEIDVQYTYTFGENQQYNFSVGAINVMDEEPPFAIFEGYVTRVHNPFMRQIYARIGATL